VRRLVCRSYGTRDGITVEDAPMPAPGPGELLIRITAANVAFVDRLIVRGGYQVRPPLPFTPGAVGAGEVVEVGPGVGHLHPGTRVVVLKSDYGTWATHIVAPARSVVQIPSGLDDAIAAASIEAYGTASYALEDRGRLRAGETVLVLGAGGAVGHAAVETAVHLDARVVTVTSDPEFWAAAPVRPAMVLDRRVIHLREAMKQRFPAGVDVVLDPVGGDMAEAALRSLGFGGRYLVVGFASGHIPRLPANHVLLRNRSVVGVEWASWITENPDNLARTIEVVLNRLARGMLHPPRPHLVALDHLPDVLLAAPPESGLVRTVVIPAGSVHSGAAAGDTVERSSTPPVRVAAGT
jgi:NADPH2:quinone reductase